MWVPRTWAEVQAVLGQPESQVLDFKRDLPGKGKGEEAAKDVAAMTSNGGVLLYGVDEDSETGEATSIPRVAVGGAPEKLQAMVGSNSSPVPFMEIIIVKENAGDAEGVLVVAVPPSTQAPHMVARRYPVRRGVTTEYLDEREVSRLYSRRSELGGPPPTPRELLDEFAAPPSTWAGGTSSLINGQGVMQIVVRPQAVTDAAHPDAPWLGNSLDHATQRARNGFGNELSPSTPSEALDRLGAWEPLGTVGWTTGHLLSDHTTMLRTSAHAATLAYPTSFSFLFSLPLFVFKDDGNAAYKCAWEWKVAVEAGAALAIAGEWLRNVEGVGPVVTVLSLGGWDSAVPFYATRARADVVAPGTAPAPGSSVQATVTTAYSTSCRTTRCLSCAASSTVGSPRSIPTTGSSTESSSPSPRPRNSGSADVICRECVGSWLALWTRSSSRNPFRRLESLRDAEHAGPAAYGDGRA